MSSEAATPPSLLAPREDAQAQSEFPNQARHRSTSPAAVSSRSSGQPAEDRIGMLWVAKWWIVAVVLIVTAGTYLVSSRLAPSFQASSTLSVAVTGTSSVSPLDLVNASNGLASQVAQLVTTSSVKEAAAKAVGRQGLAGTVSAATAANQNLVTIEVVDTDRALAAKESNALAAAVTSRVATSYNASGSAYSASVVAGLAGLNTAIAAAQGQVTLAESAAASAPSDPAASQTLTNTQTALQNLILRKQDVLSQVALDTAVQRPDVTTVSAAGTAHQIQPRPTLNAIVAAVVSLLLGAETALIVGRRRRARVLLV